MPLFRIKAKQVARIPPQEHRIKEEVIHRLIEGNLNKFFEDLVFVSSKPRIGGKEFDTLALDSSTNGPVIIEYKREKDRGVVEQVDLYYVKLKNNKPDVMILLQKRGIVEDLGQVDFDNPQILVVAKEFTPEQREILTLKKDYLRLFRYQLYEGGIVSLEQVEPLGSPSDVVKVSRSGRATSSGPYDLGHFGMNSEVRKLYDALDKGITSLDSRVKPGKVNKYFVGYGATGSYFCSVKPRVNSLKLEVKLSHKPSNTGVLKVRKVPEYQHTPMSHVFQISLQAQLKPALRIIKSALEDSL